MIIALWILTTFVFFAFISTFLKAHMYSSVDPPLINELNTVTDMFFLYPYENHRISFLLLCNSLPQIYQLKAGPIYGRTVL